MRCPAGESPLEQAIGRGDLAAVRQLVAADPAVISFRDDFGDTPLMKAIAADCLPIVEFLLAVGSDPNVEVDDGYTCLLTAIESAGESPIEIVRALLDAGADIHGEGVSGWTPLHMATARGSVEVAKLLIARGADINRRTQIDGGDTPLMEAASQGRAETVRLLLGHGADTSVRNDISGHTALEAAQDAAAGPNADVYRFLKDELHSKLHSEVLDEVFERVRNQTGAAEAALESVRDELEKHDLAASYAESAKRIQREGDFSEVIRLLSEGRENDELCP